MLKLTVGQRLADVVMDVSRGVACGLTAFLNFPCARCIDETTLKAPRTTYSTKHDVFVLALHEANTKISYDCLNDLFRTWVKLVSTLCMFMLSYSRTMIQSFRLRLNHDVLS